MCYVFDFGLLFHYIPLMAVSILLSAAKALLELFFH